MGCRGFKRMLYCRPEELTDRERRQLRTHLAGCPACTKEGASAAATHGQIASLREIGVEAVDPERLTRDILEATSREQGVMRHAPQTSSVVLRILDLVASPAYAVGATLAILLVVGSALWQTGVVVGDIARMESRQSHVTRTPPPLPAVAYAIDIQRIGMPLDPGVVRAAGLFINNGTLVVPVQVANAMHAANTHAAVGWWFPERTLPKVETLRSWARIAAHQARPVLSYMNPKGV